MASTAAATTPAVQASVNLSQNKVWSDDHKLCFRRDGDLIPWHDVDHELVYGKGDNKVVAKPQTARYLVKFSEVEKEFYKDLGHSKEVAKRITNFGGLAPTQLTQYSNMIILLAGESVQASGDMDCIVQQAVLETLVLRYAWHFAHNTGPFGEGGLYHVAGVQAPKDVPWSRYTYWVATRPMVADPPALWQRYLSLRRDLQNVYAPEYNKLLERQPGNKIPSGASLSSFADEVLDSFWLKTTSGNAYTGKRKEWEEKVEALTGVEGAEMPAEPEKKVDYDNISIRLAWERYGPLSKNPLLTVVVPKADGSASVATVSRRDRRAAVGATILSGQPYRDLTGQSGRASDVRHLADILQHGQHVAALAAELTAAEEGLEGTRLHIKFLKEDLGYTKQDLADEHQKYEKERQEVEALKKAIRARLASASAAATVPVAVKSSHVASGTSDEADTTSSAATERSPAAGVAGETRSASSKKRATAQHDDDDDDDGDDDSQDEDGKDTSSVSVGVFRLRQSDRERRKRIRPSL